MSDILADPLSACPTVEFEENKWRTQAVQQREQRQHVSDTGRSEGVIYDSTLANIEYKRANRERQAERLQVEDKEAKEDSNML